MTEPRCGAEAPFDWYSITKLGLFELDKGRPVACELLAGHIGDHRRYCIMDKDNPADRWPNDR